jgi:hypothetical protein
VGQEDILLALVEAVDFIHEQDGAHPRQPFSFALSRAARISLMPEVTAESRSTSAWQ